MAREKPHAAFAAAVPAALRSEARSREAAAYFARGDWGAAAAAFSDALRCADDARAGDAAADAALEGLRLKLANNLAVAALRGAPDARLAKQAEAACDVALGIDAACPKARFRRGLARALLGKRDGARDDFDAVVRDSGDAPRADVRIIRDAAVRELEQLDAAEALGIEAPIETPPAPAGVEAPQRPPQVRPKAEPAFKRGFLFEKAALAEERRRQATEAKRRDPARRIPGGAASAPLGPVVERRQSATDAVGPETRYAGGRRSADRAPPSVYTEAEPFGTGYDDDDDGAPDGVIDMIDSLRIALKEARDSRDEASRRLDVVAPPGAEAAPDDATAGIRSLCTEALGRIDGFLLLAAPALVDARRRPRSLVGSQLAARSDALRDVAARLALLHGRAGGDLVAAATAALGYCSTNGVSHWSREALARDAYAMRAGAHRAADAREEAMDDALRCLALDQWAPDAIELVGDLFRKKAARASRITLGLSARAAALHRPGSEFRGKRGSGEGGPGGGDFVAPLRAGEKIAGARRGARQATIDNEMAKRASFGAIWDQAADAPAAWADRAPAGDVASGSPVHLFLFANDGAWSGGRHVCVPRTIGATRLVLDHAAAWLGLRHECAIACSLYRRNGQQTVDLPILRNFDWLAVGDDFEAMFASKRGPRESRYVRPPAAAAVARDWHITAPAAGRRCAHWLVGGRVKAFDAAKNLAGALDHVANGRGPVVLRRAGAVLAVDAACSPTADEAVETSADDDAAETWAYAASEGSDALRCCCQPTPGDFPRSGARPSEEDTAAIQADGGAARLKLEDGAAAEPDVTISRLARVRLEPRMAALARVGAEAPFGAVAAVDARSAAAGAVLAARFDRGGVAHAQVEGVSRFLVFDSLHHPSLYAYPDAHPLRNYSRLDLQRPDIDAFPLAAMLRGLEVELGPGDVLLLPRGWWRHEECVSSGGALRNEALVVRFATHDDVYQSQDGVLDGADLALAAAKVEREVLAVLGSPARVERCLRDLRSDVVRSGCDCEDPARDADAALCDVEPETSEVDGALLRACVRDARYALGEVVGVDAVEPFVLRYLSAARWKGLAFKASPHDDDGALSSQSSAQAGITRTRLDTAPDAGEDASDDAWDDDDSDGELPIVHDVTDAHL